jgi:hypothetical protein
MKTAFDYFTPHLPEPWGESEFLPNFVNAYLCANLSKLCYKNSVLAQHTDQDYKEAVYKTLQSWGLTQEDTDKTIFLNSREIESGKNHRPGTQGLIVFYRDTVFISFRGSEKKLDDWLSNFNSKKVPSPYLPKNGGEKHHILKILNSEIKDIITDISVADVKVHQGFLEAFRAVLAEKGEAHEQLEKIVDSLKEGRVKNVWLTGHSLGGALSSIAAHCLLFFNLPVSGLYTFGAPRVGNTGYRIYMNKKLTYKHWRFAYEHDLVPDIPFPTPSPLLPGSRVMGFSRDGCMLRLEETGSYKVLREINQNGERKVLHSYTGKNAKDHSINNYIENLRILVSNIIPDFPDMNFLDVPVHMELNSTPDELNELELTLAASNHLGDMTKAKP